MGKTVRIPDPVYNAATTEAERRDISRGAVIADWREKAEKYEEVERGHRR
jgi:hypothetical protein